MFPLCIVHQFAFIYMHCLALVFCYDNVLCDRSHVRLVNNYQCLLLLDI